MKIKDTVYGRQSRTMGQNWWMWLLMLGWLSGCGQQPGPVSQSNAKVTQAQKTPESKAEEVWYAYYLQGDKLGYMRQEQQTLVERGQTLVRTLADSRLKLQRQGQVAEVRLAFTTWETPSGALVRLHGEANLGPTPTLYHGRVNGDHLELETLVSGQGQSVHIPWPANAGGFFAIEQSLERSPMQTGQQRTLQKLEPIINELITVDLHAFAWEVTPLLQDSAELLRIDCTMKFADGNRLHSNLWTDRQGRTLKTYSLADRIESYRTTREQALSASPAARFDLALNTQIPLNRRLDNPHQADQIKYRVQWEDGNPAEMFSHGPSQRVQTLDDHIAEITVRRIRPETQSDGDWPISEPAAGEEFQTSNSLIQSDDPLLQQMAQQAVPGVRDPWQLATELEGFVHRKIERKNFSQAFASALDVARDLQGDCTEHAVLLAALCRARAVPTRVAIGLVYIDDDQPALAFHMWNEIYLHDRWIPLDATLGRGGIGGGHLKLAHTSLQGGSAYTSFLNVSRVMGRLKVDVMEVQ